MAIGYPVWKTEKGFRCCSTCTYLGYDEATYARYCELSGEQVINTDMFVCEAQRFDEGSIYIALQEKFE